MATQLTTPPVSQEDVAPLHDSVTSIIQTTEAPSNQEVELTLHEAYSAFAGDPQHSIPLPVWFLENPDSPLSFPGQIYLREHDYLHILLDRGVTPEDEAFVVGFTMGNDPKTTEQHVAAFKFAARFIYPKLYRFTTAHLMIFDWGFRFGSRTTVKNLNVLDYTPFFEMKLTQFREQIGIDIKGIQYLLGPSASRPWVPET